jgi:hypothetical protein
MVDKKITPKAAGSKEKGSADRAAARVSLKRTHKKTARKMSHKKTSKKI